MGYLPGKPSKITPFSGKKLAENMFTLNCDSVEQRYGEGQAEQFRSLDFKYNPSKKQMDVFQILKNINCFLYQCSEGDIMQKKLYKVLEKVVGNIALSIVREMPQYEKAKWA